MSEFDQPVRPTDLVPAGSDRETRLAAAPELSWGYVQTITRRAAQSPQDRRIVQAVIELARHGGYAAVSRRTIRDRTSLRYDAINARFDSGDQAFRAAYDDISQTILDELGDCVRVAASSRSRIESCVHALVDFAITGGGAADLWLLAVHDASFETREQRTVVLATMAKLISRGTTRPRTYTQADAVRALLLLGGVLETLVTRLRIRDYASMRSTEPDLIAFAVSMHTS